MTQNILILNLIQEIKSYLELRCLERAGVAEVLGRLAEVQLTPDRMISQEPQVPAHSDLLDTAIDNITEPALGPLANAIRAAKDHLHWRVDHGHFYVGDADIGKDYLGGNLHCVLVGSDVGVIPHDDFLLGFFLLAPRVLYRDHLHAAPELYLNLVGPTGWRFGQGEWVDYSAGSTVWNTPNSVHAMRVYDQPFFSVFSWTADVARMCEVVPADDWSQIEADLLSP